MQPRPYKDFGRQFVAGEWREGRSTEHIIVDENPYSREVLLRIPGAVPDDVDTAYKEARRAQVDWAAKLPRERAEVLLAAARVFEARHQEIVDWLAREAGATRFWAEQISSHAAVCCSEAAAYAQSPAGVVMPTLQPGQQSTVFRRPVGVIALITS